MDTTTHLCREGTRISGALWGKDQYLGTRNACPKEIENNALCGVNGVGLVFVYAFKVSTKLA